MPVPRPDTTAWFVATKLHSPLVRNDTIPRPRLEAALGESVRTLPLTLLSAPAGYGKTTMLAALPRLLPDYPLTWVTLDAEDNDPVRFIGLLTVALQKLRPDCGRSVWPWLAGGVAERAALKQAMGALINDILECLPDPFVLVLDDLHFVTEPAVYVALEYLLDHLPPQMHLAVGTRHDPPLRLARLAARRQLAELRRPDLGFSPDETRQLLNGTLGLRLSTAEVASLQERTEGWPAGLCLIAGPLGRMDSAADRSHFMAAVAQMERYALDFFAEEVLRNLPEDRRLFLMRTSILAEMTPSACRAVTGRDDAAEVLEAFYRQNLTIASITSEDDGEPVYRHHALFARLLLRQLEREMPQEIAALHTRAAHVQRTPGRAIAHLLSAGLWDEAAELMLQSGGELLRRGMAETVRNWVGSLPAEVRTRNPRLAILMGRCEIHRGDYAAAGEQLNLAREACVASGDAAGEGEALTSLLTLAYQNDDRKAAETLVARAVQLPLSPMGQVASRLVRAWLHLADCDWTASRVDINEALAIPGATGVRLADLIGITYMSAPLAATPGCPEPTERYCLEASALAPPGTAWRLGADELSGWPLLWKGRVDEALAQAEAAEAVRQRLGGYPFVGVDAAVLLAVIRLARGEREAAGRAVETAIQRIEAAPRGKWAFYLHAAGRTLALLGRYDEAEGMRRRLAVRQDGTPLAEYLHDHLAGMLALLQGRRAEAAAALGRAAKLEESLAVAWVGGSARLLFARLRLDEGKPTEALALLAPVLKEWDEAGLPGCVLLDGPAGFPVVRLAAQRGNDTAARMSGLFTTESQRDNPAALLPEPLTQREREVLRLIVAGCTNRQIGERLFITSETVKSHVVHILRKLDVTSRTQAAVRGRELGF